MSGLAEKAEQYGENKLNQDAQGGDSVEKKADSSANSEINKVADQSGLGGVGGGKGEKVADDVADKKINSEIPGGN